MVVVTGGLAVVPAEDGAVLTTEHVPHAVPAAAVAAPSLDLKSGRDNGRIYRLAPKGFRSPKPPQLSKATTAELVAALESPHGWWRDTAHRLLYERQDGSAVPALEKVATQSASAASRVQALWSLRGLDALAESVLSTALTDAHPGVR